MGRGRRSVEVPRLKSKCLSGLAFPAAETTAGSWGHCGGRGRLAGARLMAQLRCEQKPGASRQFPPTSANSAKKTVCRWLEETGSGAGNRRLAVLSPQDRQPGVSLPRSL